MNQDSLWDIVKALKSVWGKQANDVSQLLRQPLVRVLPTADDRFTSAPFTLLDGTRLSGLDVRLWNNGEKTVSMVSFIVDSPCITLKQVKEYFPDAKLFNVPNGHAIGQMIGYRTAKDSRGLAWAFSFPEQDSRCLKRITMAKYVY
ncbi:hypothetical protein EHJ07_00230 [Cronobacter muytjensii]|nr:hypothetical protein [Cronobacter muytjensii]